MIKEIVANHYCYQDQKGQEHRNHHWHNQIIAVCRDPCHESLQGHPYKRRSPLMVFGYHLALQSLRCTRQVEMIPTSFPELPKPSGTTGHCQKLMFCIPIFLAEKKETSFVSLISPFKGPYFLGPPVGSPSGRCGARHSFVHRPYLFRLQCEVGSGGFRFFPKPISGVIGLSGGAPAKRKSQEKIQKHVETYKNIEIYVFDNFRLRTKDLSISTSKTDSTQTTTPLGDLQPPEIEDLDQYA